MIWGYHDFGNLQIDTFYSSFPGVRHRLSLPSFAVSFEKTGAGALVGMENLPFLIHVGNPGIHHLGMVKIVGFTT